MELVFTRTFHFCQNVTIERLLHLQFPNIFLKDLVSFLYTKQVNADFFSTYNKFTELNLSAQAGSICVIPQGWGDGGQEATWPQGDWGRGHGLSIEKAWWAAYHSHCPEMRLAVGGGPEAEGPAGARAGDQPACLQVGADKTGGGGRGEP